VIGAILRASRLIESAKPETEIRKNLAKETLVLLPGFVTDAKTLEATLHARFGSGEQTA
jgi:hypothetical protein